MASLRNRVREAADERLGEAIKTAVTVLLWIAWAALDIKVGNSLLDEVLVDILVVAVLSLVVQTSDILLFSRPRINVQWFKWDGDDPEKLRELSGRQIPIPVSQAGGLAWIHVRTELAPRSLVASAIVKRLSSRRDTHLTVELVPSRGFLYTLENARGLTAERLPLRKGTRILLEEPIDDGVISELSVALEPDLALGPLVLSPRCTVQSASRRWVVRFVTLALDLESFVLMENP